MRKFARADEPDFLAQKWEAWGRSWEQRRVANGGAQFHWHRIEDQPVNQKLLPLLKKQVQDHCSFCDNFPVCPPSIETIEHFRPKSAFPLLAYRWTNLYFCCTYCQQKGEDFDELALQPDVVEYQFERYFRWDFTRGTMEVNDHASPEDQLRADATIKLYRLNIGHPSLRRRELHRRAKLQDDPLDDFAYRDFVKS